MQEESERKKDHLQELDSDLAGVSLPLSPLHSLIGGCGLLTDWWVWPAEGVADSAETDEGQCESGQPEIEAERGARLPHTAPERLRGTTGSGGAWLNMCMCEGLCVRFSIIFVFVFTYFISCSECRVGEQIGRIAESAFSHHSPVCWAA